MKIIASEIFIIVYFFKFIFLYFKRIKITAANILPTFQNKNFNPCFWISNVVCIQSSIIVPFCK